MVVGKSTMEIQLSEDEFAALYQPIANHLNPNAPFDWGQGYGTIFETFGEELKYVRSQPPSTVWTFLSGDGDVIVSGYHLVNRVGYFICRVPVGADTSVSVALDFDG